MLHRPYISFFALKRQKICTFHVQRILRRLLVNAEPLDIEHWRYPRARKFFI